MRHEEFAVYEVSSPRMHAGNMTKIVGRAELFRDYKPLTEGKQRGTRTPHGGGGAGRQAGLTSADTSAVEAREKKWWAR